MWRAKDMNAEEIDRFTRIFRTVYNLSILNGDMALMLHQEEDEPGGTVAITGHQSVFLEITSPGGWRHCEPPAGDGWSPLVGTMPVQSGAAYTSFMTAD